jgi:hypothetical protein
MKRNERFVVPPIGEDKRRYVWWAKRVGEEVRVARWRNVGDAALPFSVKFVDVPAHGLAYLVNELQSEDCGLFLVSALRKRSVVYDDFGVHKRKGEYAYSYTCVFSCSPSEYSEGHMWTFIHPLLPSEEPQ